MGRRLGFAALSQKVYTKIVILLCLILILGSAGIAQMVFAIPEYLDKGLNPIPYSPAPPKNLNKINSTVDVTYNNGYRVYNSGDGWRSVSPEPLPTGETVPAKLNAYAACKSVNETPGGTTVMDSTFRLAYDSQSGVRTSSLLMYPQIKDIVPPVATINSAVLVSSQRLLNGVFMPIEAYEITSSWDPRTFNGVMPTLSQQPIGTGVFDDNSSTATNRTVNVTTTVQNWFNGISPQWGFYIKTSSSNSIINEYLYPPRLYIDYTMPEGSFSSATVSGGTWYDDGICPGMWIPRRATYIAKEGILGNDVQTSVCMATTMDAPFGFDNQSFRWVIGGKPNNPNVDYQPCDLNIEIESVKFFSNTIWRLPAINNRLFSTKPPPPPTTQPYPPPETPIQEAGTDDPPEPPGQNKKNDDDVPPDSPAVFYFCDFWKKWVDDPPTIQPPPPTPDPAICSTNPPILKMPPQGSLETYSWSATKNQWVTFKSNNPSFSDLSKVTIGSSNWLSEVVKPNLSGRISPGGISDLSYASSLGPLINNNHITTSSENNYKISTINTINSVPPPGHWEYGNSNIRTVVIYPKRWGVRNSSGDLCVNCEPIGNPPQQPHSSDSVEAYDTKLPYPEITQSNNIGYGNNETALDKEMFTGPGYVANPLNGAVEHKYVDFSIPIHGNLNLEFSRSYSSIMGNVGSILGLGWSTNIDEKISYLQEGYISYLSSSGENYIFTPNRNENSTIISYASPPQLDAKATLIVNGEQTYVKIEDKDGFISKVFDNKGLIKYIRSQFGGEIEVIRNVQGQVTQLKDNYSGRYLEFTYDTYGRLVSVLAPENRNWTYAYNVNGLLSTATNPIGGTWNYEYSNNKLSKITNPRGNDTYFTYGTNNKVNNIQQEGSTNSTNIYYSSSDYHSTKIVKPAGETYYEVFSQDSQLAAVIDGNGKYGIVDYHPLQMEKPTTLFNQIGDFVAANLYNQNGDILKQFDADGNYKEYTYTANGKIASYKDRASKTTSITWNQDESMPIKIMDALGRETIYEYDTNKNLIKIKTPFKDNNPAETMFEYDTNGYVKKITNALGKTTEYTYNNCGEVTSVKDTYGKITSYTLDKMGMVTKVTGPSPDNREGTNAYDACQNLISTTNFRGYTTTYEYDQRENRIKATNALNQNTYYTYDDSGKLTKVKDHKNNETSLTYDNLGRILKITDQDGKYTEALYDDLGRVSGYKNKLGDETSIEYNTLYRQSQATSAQGAETKYEYDKEGHVTKVIDPLNRSTYFEYDACYQLTKVTDNAGKYSTIEYWPSGQIKKSTDPLNHITEYDYNKLGLPVSVKDNEAHETTMLYDDLGRCTRVTNALNGYKSFEYNMYGLLTKSTNELGKFTTYEYDENGNLTKQTTPLGKEYRWTYDAIDRVKKTITPMGFEYEKTYDEVGNVIEIKDPLQHLESFEYTSTYNLSKYIDQINNQTSYNYNDANDLTKTTLPKGTFQEYTYDKDGNVKTVIDPLGNTATYNYNIGGELTERQLPKIGGGTTSFTYTYDTVGRRTTFTDEASKSTTCTYNDIGLVTQLSHPNSKTISSTYDTLNRLTGITFGGGETFSYSYDVLGRTTGATDQHGTKSISYDAASRVTSSTDPFGDQTSLSYDDDDRVTSVTTPLGATSTTYDNDSRPTQINLASGGQINNTFDNAARLTHSDLPNGVDLDFTYNNANNPTNKTYSLPDPFFNNSPKVQTSRPKDPDSLFVTIGKQAQFLHNKLGPNPTFGDICTLLLDQKFYGTLRTLPVTIASFSYTYDANKNISQRSYPGGIQNFTYDNYDRLTQATASEGTYTYTYDVRNNRSTMRFVNYDLTVDQTTSYTYSIDDRLTSYTVVNNLNQQTIRTVNYTYDDAGNTLTKAVTEGGTTLTTTYTYYDDNRLKTATLPSSEVITYTYHADGTRATKTNATEWIRYHYSGGLVKEVHCDKNNHSTILFTIHYQPGRIIYQPNQGNNIYYYTASDCSGTIYKLLNDQGQIVASYNYDPFGVLIENTNPSIYMPIGYSGTYRDTETGLLYAQSRYYDPSVGRFTTKDSYRGELVSQISQNRYIYCSQNPVSYGDPSGFAPIEGDDANEVSICTQKTKNEQAVKPLKQSKIIEGEQWGITPGGASYNPKDGSFTINIGGSEIKMKYDPKTGNCVVYSKNPNDPVGVEIAKGIQNALNMLPKEMKDSIFKDLSSVGHFAQKLNAFYQNNFTDYQNMYGAEGNLTHFFFSATVGYACAKYMMGSSDPSDIGLRCLVGGIINAENGGKTSNLEDQTFDRFMIYGFWQAHFNSSGNAMSGYKLNQPFTGPKGTSWDSNASFMDQVRVLAISDSFARTDHLLNEAGFSRSDIFSGISLAFSALGFIGVSVATIAAAAAAAAGALSFLTGFISLAISMQNTYDNSPINNLGLTNGMLEACSHHGLVLVYPPSLPGRPKCDINKTFCAIGLMANYYHACLHVVMGDLKPGQSGKVKIGDLYRSFGLYLNAYLNNSPNVFDASLEASDFFIKYYFGKNYNSEISYTDWKKSRYNKRDVVLP